MALFRYTTRGMSSDLPEASSYFKIFSTLEPKWVLNLVPLPFIPLEIELIKETIF